MELLRLTVQCCGVVCCAGILVIYWPGILEKPQMKTNWQVVGRKDKARATVIFGFGNILVSILNGWTKPLRGGGRRAGGYCFCRLRYFASFLVAARLRRRSAGFVELTSLGFFMNEPLSDFISCGSRSGVLTRVCSAAATTRSKVASQGRDLRKTIGAHLNRLPLARSSLTERYTRRDCTLLQSP